jgi:hypothetical protein
MQGLEAVEAEGKKAKFTDLLVSSQTGSGKTAAFLLPVLHTLLKQAEEAERFERAEFERLSAEAVAKGEAPLKKPKRKDPTNVRNFKAATPGALILCPTRELAQQVCADAIDLVRHCRGLRVANVVGGIPYQLQIAKLQNANLVVATPGRLLDLQRSMQIKLDQVQFRSRLCRRPDRSQSAHAATPSDHDVQRHFCAAHHAAGYPRHARAAARRDRFAARQAHLHHAVAAVGRQHDAQAQVTRPLVA